MTAANAPGATPAAARAVRPRTPAGPRSLAQRLFESPYEFDFFQAVRLLERLAPDRHPVGYDGNPSAEAVRFCAQVGSVFPPAAITDLRPGEGTYPPAMTVTFMGLTGPSGVLPHPYTELVRRLERDSKLAEKGALGAWLDLFNHRLVSLFYRTWEKYRFYIAFERGEHASAEPDPFHQCLFSLLGIGAPSFRNRLRMRDRGEDGLVERSAAAGEPSLSGDGAVADTTAAPPERMAEIPDLALAYYAGLLAHRPRSAIGLQLLLGDFFGVPVQVQQFRGQWARLENSDRSRLIRGLAGHCKLGEDAVLGERVWESESQFRICVGPVDLPQFEQYLPDRGAPSNKTFFLLCHLTRFYVGPSLEFDVQMILAPESVPMTRLGGSDASRHSAETRGGEASPGGGLVPAASASAAPAEGPKASLGPRLGWNTWIYNRPPTGPASDAIFAGRELFWSNDDARTSSPLQAT